LSITKALFLKAARLKIILPHILAILIFYLAYFGLAIHFFKKREA